MGADVLGTQGTKASATVIFTMLNRIISVSDRWSNVWIIDYMQQSIIHPREIYECGVYML